jgi:TatD DNase family protein
VIDTHCHLSSSRYKKDRSQVMRRARAAGVTHFIEVGYDLATSKRSVELAAAETDVWAAVGLHPHEVGGATPAAREEIAALAGAPRVVAIGEIGLDFYRNLSPPDVQRAWFADQLRLAADAGLPVIIHSRDAMDEVLETLEKLAPPRRGVLHCWSGDAAQARRAVGLGFRVAFGGTLTYGDAQLEESARSAPKSALVLETDSPYLVPMPKDTKRNEPALLSRVRARLAVLRGESEGEVDAFTTQNALELFAIGAS